MRTPDEQPQVQARLRGAIRIKAGPDITDVLGLDSGIANASVASSLIVGQLQDIGSIESLDLVQNRDLRPRYAFGPNPQQPFQVIPFGQKLTLTASRVVLKNLSVAERVFNFAPSNLIFQQVPFTIMVRDIGDPKKPETEVVHYIFGCWFGQSTVKYDVLSKDDQRLINNVTITCGRILTFDNSIAGSQATTATRDIFSGVMAIDSVQNLIEDFPLA